MGRTNSTAGDGSWTTPGHKFCLHCIYDSLFKPFIRFCNVPICQLKQLFCSSGSLLGCSQKISIVAIITPCLALLQEVIQISKHTIWGSTQILPWWLSVHTAQSTSTAHRWHNSVIHANTYINCSVKQKCIYVWQSLECHIVPYFTSALSVGCDCVINVVGSVFSPWVLRFHQAPVTTAPFLFLFFLCSVPSSLPFSLHIFSVSLSLSPLRSHVMSLLTMQPNALLQLFKQPMCMMLSYWTPKILKALKKLWKVRGLWMLNFCLCVDTFLL